MIEQEPMYPAVVRMRGAKQGLPRAAARLAALVAVAALALSVACPCSATVIRVPQDQATIAQGLAAASYPDTVLVAAGIYYEHGLMMKSGVCLRSECGEPECVTIDAENLDTVIECFDVDNAARIEGFTLRNGLATQGGWPHGSAGGVLCVDSSPTISKCLFIDGNGRLAGGGLYSNGGSPTLSECAFIGNTARYGGGVAWHGGAPHVLACVFQGNEAWYTGGGGIVSAQTGHSALISDCLFESNTSAFRGGAIGTDNSGVVIRRCTFSRNVAPTGSALSFWGASPWVEQCTVADSQPSDGSALVCLEGATVYIDNSIVAFTSAGPSIGCDGDSEAILACTDVYGNTGGDWVGCIAGQAGADGNMCADPLFCRDLNPGHPYTLTAGSPCAPEESPECGLIGAWDVGCGQTPAEVSTWGRIKATYR